jgi:hypothetical protein
MPCVFRVLTGPYRGKVFPVETGRPLLVGKALEADFTIPDGTLEPFHVKVDFDEGASGHMARVTSLQPEKISIEVDGVPFDEALVKSGDRFRIGETTLEFREGGRPDDPPSGRRALAGAPCVACRRPVPELGGGRVILGAVYCVRCVDLRLTVRRDLGRFRVLRKMARDAAEIVYVAEDLSRTPPERVALHVLKSERQHDPRVLRRFLTKAVFATTLDHPAFGRTRDLVRRAEAVQYVEDLCEWPTLEERVLSQETFPLDTAAKICREIAGALRFARKKGILVGRLRAPKIQVSPEGAVRIKDYWLFPEVEERVAASLAPSDLAPGPRAVGAGLATDDSSEMRRYLAPDERDMAHARDESLDVKPIGICFFQLATGTHPGDARPQELVERLKKAYFRCRRTTSPPSFAPIVAKLVARTLDPNPANRYRTLDDLARDFAAAAAAV